MHDPDFRQSEKDFQMFTERLTQKLIQADETIPELPVKDVVSRYEGQSLGEMFKKFRRSFEYIET